jgi:hypothetical protein
MLNYQIRVLDSGGTNAALHTLACKDDYEALALARSLIGGGGIAHVWDGPRSVGQIFLPLPWAAE